MATWLFRNNMLVMVMFLIISSFAAVLLANQSPKIVIGMPYTGKKGVLRLPEDTPLNSYLGIMETKDEDSGPAGEVECVTDNPYISIPLVYPKTYKVELVKELDRETVNHVQVSILCNDKGEPPITSTAMFTIEIVDINDNPPTFAKGAYNANVSEGVPIGTHVTRVKAVDPDAEQNGNVQYYLYSDALTNVSHFSIDKDTGKIVTTMDIDRERTNHYLITVVAKDSGLPSQTSSVQVRIEVDDVNDNVPQILTKELHVNENEKQMSFVGTLLARDLDIGKNSDLVFSKMENSQSSSTAPFLIQPNGEILSVVSLDREQRQEYVMEVAVRDKGNPRLSSTATISIFVDDVNDNAPIITSKCLDDIDYDDDDEFNGDLTFVRYAAGSNITNGIVFIDWYTNDNEKVVYQVEAVDGDSGENGKLHYVIESAVSGDSVNMTVVNDPLFQIDSDTGKISLRRFVRRTDSLVQILNISANDNGNPSLNAFCLLNVTVDVDVSLLTTSKPTNVKGKASMKDSSVENNAHTAFSFTGVFITRHFGASLTSLLLWCFHIIFLYS